MSMVVLPLLLLGGADFARVFYYTISLNSAARAGAQYGSQGNANAADTAGMKTAATNDGSNIPGISASASQCTCAAGTTVASCTSSPFSMPASYCTAKNGAGTTVNSGATFVVVTATATYKTIVNYPGIPHSTPLSSTAIMQVEQ
jgi:Flp pilus assembly protein TadG